MTTPTPTSVLAKLKAGGTPNVVLETAGLQQFAASVKQAERSHASRNVDEHEDAYLEGYVLYERSGVGEHVSLSPTPYIFEELDDAVKAARYILHGYLHGLVICFEQWDTAEETCLDSDFYQDVE